MAQAQDGSPAAPLSSIDWMSAILRAPTPAIQPQSNTTDEPAVASSASISDVTVTTLDDATNSTIGLLPFSVTGLPATLWSGSPSDQLARQIAQIGTPHYPALQDLMRLLLLAEVDTPLDNSATLVLARAKALSAMGSVEAAQALIARAQPLTQATFAQLFNLSLILGVEDDACKIWADAPGLSTDAAVRVFCLARAQDWMAANLTLQTGAALGAIPAQTANLLDQFMDPEFAETAALLPPSNAITAMDFRLREAIGATVPTGSLPLPFAVADLQTNRGWKSRLEAAERLARTGALPDNQFLGVFTEKLPSASGQIWDRVDAVQRFDVAVTARDPNAVAKNLNRTFDKLANAGLAVPFARLYAEKIAGLPLPEAAQHTARKIGYLSASYEATAKTDTNSLAKAIALGQVDATPTSSPKESALKQGFLAETSPLPASTPLGARILQAIQMIEAVPANDISQLAMGIATLRSVGLEDVARRVALQVLLL